MTHIFYFKNFNFWHVVCIKYKSGKLNSLFVHIYTLIFSCFGYSFPLFFVALTGIEPVSKV